MNVKSVWLPILTGAVLAAAGTGCFSLNPSSGRADAERIALGRLPGGQIQSAQLERVGGRRVWAVNISAPGSKHLVEVFVDAHTGDIVMTDLKTPTGLLSAAKADGSR